MSKTQSYGSFEVVAICIACGCELTRQDDEDGLVVWTDNSTGVKIPYCRDCAEQGVNG